MGGHNDAKQEAQLPIMYQVVGFGRGDGRHSDGRSRSVVSSVKGDGV